MQVSDFIASSTATAAIGLFLTLAGCTSNLADSLRRFFAGDSSSYVSRSVTRSTEMRRTMNAMQSTISRIVTPQQAQRSVLTV